MVYFKAIVSGNVVEIYEYERTPQIEDFEPNEHEISDVAKKIISSLDIDRKDERRKQTMRDARNMARRLALMNFGQGDLFVTLTVAENLNDIDYFDNEFKKFVKRWRHKTKQKIRYIAVREFQKRGAIHYHLICDWKIVFRDDEHLKEVERWLSEIWRHGFCDIKVIDGVDNVGAYLIKYMTKNVWLEVFRGRKIYLCSKGLERPIEYKGIEALRLIDALELQNKTEVYANSYKSEYLGEIKYKEFNLSR